MLVAVPAVALHRFFRDSIPFVIQFGKLLKGSGEQKKYDANAIRDDLYEGLGMEKRATTSIKRQPRHQPRGGGHAQMLRAALDIAAEGSWRDTSLSDIADRADMDIAEICVLAPTKMTLTSLLIDAVDQQVMAGGPAEKEDTVRLRLFDLLMRRFDALNENRDGVLAFMREGHRNPLAALCVATRLMRSMAMTLEVAGLSSSGLLGLARVNGLAVVYGYAVRTWQTDDSPDMAATMAALDRALATAGLIIEQLENGFIPQRQADVAN